MARLTIPPFTSPCVILFIRESIYINYGLWNLVREVPGGALVSQGGGNRNYRATFSISLDRPSRSLAIASDVSAA